MNTEVTSNYIWKGLLVIWSDVDGVETKVTELLSQAAAIHRRPQIHVILASRHSVLYTRVMGYGGVNQWSTATYQISPSSVHVGMWVYTPKTKNVTPFQNIKMPFWGRIPCTVFNASHRCMRVGVADDVLSAATYTGEKGLINLRTDPFTALHTPPIEVAVNVLIHSYTKLTRRRTQPYVQPNAWIFFGLPCRHTSTFSTVCKVVNYKFKTCLFLQKFKFIVWRLIHNMKFRPTRSCSLNPAGMPISFFSFSSTIL